MRKLFTKTVRRYLTGADSRYCFEAVRAPDAEAIESTNLYVHIPFCKNCCPYCPYHKIKYDANLAEPYLDALLREVEMYYQLHGSIEVSSIYIGGGTPTLLIDQLGVLLERIRGRFKLIGDVCIETIPNDVDDKLAEKLNSFGVGLVSLGVQSFNEKYLKLIGRNYTSATVEPAVKMFLGRDFKSVNIDLIFSLPGQTITELQEDLEKAVSSGARQITTYPLFTFPYTSVGRYKKLKKIRMPNLLQRRRHYKFINEFLSDKGFERVSVWSYRNGDVPRYSSVTRDGYIGLGAGAGSHTGNGFYLNTFSIDEYIASCLEYKFPTALHMGFSEKMRKYFWFYWRLYDTCVSKSELNEQFGTNEKELRQLLGMLRLLRFSDERDGYIQLNDRGAFWEHLLQNYFALDYINKVWSVAKEQPWPTRVAL